MIYISKDDQIKALQEEIGRYVEQCTTHIHFDMLTLKWKFDFYFFTDRSAKQIFIFRSEALTKEDLFENGEFTINTMKPGISCPELLHKLNCQSFEGMVDCMKAVAISLKVREPA